MSLLERNAPNEAMLSVDANWWTEAGFDERQAAWAGRLRASGPPGSRVAGLALNHPDHLALLLACVDAGWLWVPLNTRLAEPEWAAILADCSPRLLLHDAAHASAATRLGAAAGVEVGEMGSRAGATLSARPPGRPEAAAPPGHEPDDEAPALLVYTSGTTGRPKGAVHTVANLRANAQAAISAQELSASDHVLTVLPLFHVGGLCIQTLPALMAGARVSLHSRFSPGAFFDALASSDPPSLTLQVPATLKALTEHPRWATADLSCLRAVWAGSSVLPEALVRAVLAKGVPLCNVYGATETGPFSVALGPTHSASHVGSCGWPAQGVEARLAAPSSDGVGEIQLRSPAIVRRYWSAPGGAERSGQGLDDTFAALSADGWFATGDLARVADDGSWWVVGRAKDMIISGGENIYPAEVEQLLAALPGVAECAVVGLPDARWGEVPIAAVVVAPSSNSGATLTETGVLAALQGQLARYKLPRCVVFVNALPKTALGKVQKPLLASALAAQLSAAALTAANGPPAK